MKAYVYGKADCRPVKRLLDNVSETFEEFGIRFDCKSFPAELDSHRIEFQKQVHDFSPDILIIHASDFGKSRFFAFFSLLYSIPDIDKIKVFCLVDSPEFFDWFDKTDTDVKFPDTTVLPLSAFLGERAPKVPKTKGLQGLASLKRLLNHKKKEPVPLPELGRLAAMYEFRWEKVFVHHFIPVGEFPDQGVFFFRSRKKNFGYGYLHEYADPTR